MRIKWCWSRGGGGVERSKRNGGEGGKGRKNDGERGKERCKGIVRGMVSGGERERWWMERDYSA